MTTYINGRRLVDAPNAFTHTIKTRPFRGKAYEYIVNASKKLGRDIAKDEVVHHIDGDKTNNNSENLMVFCSKTAHSLFHGNNCDNSLLVPLANGTFDVNRDKIAIRNSHTCQKCGASLHRYGKGVLCARCSAAERRNPNRPTDEELRKLVWEHPSSTIAKMLGVSDTAIGKWCKQAGIEKPARGYWSKKEATVVRLHL